jgi:hypothetical protein
MGFKKAVANKIGLKILIYGFEGSGKTYFQLTAPKVACIDTETGIQLYVEKEIELNDGSKHNNLQFVDESADLSELENNIEALNDGEYDGQVETLSIDSESKIYAMQQIAANEVEERRARRKGGDVDDTTISVKQWGRIKLLTLKLQQAKIALSAKGVNIISVCHAEEVYEGVGDNRKLKGLKPSCHKSLPFDYDIILEFFKKEEPEGVRYFCKVKKDRSNVTKEGQIIENPKFGIWSDYLKSRKGLKESKNTYRDDIKTSTDNLVDKADKAEELAEKLKDIMKRMNKAKNADGVSKIIALIKEKGIDAKKLELQTVEDLTELIDFAELQ